MNAPDRPPVRARDRAVRPARGVHVALVGVRGRGAARQPEQPAAPVRGAADQARDHPRRRRHRAGGQPCALAGPFRAPLSHRRAVRAPRRLLVAGPWAHRARGLLQRRADGPPQRRDRRARAAARPAGRRRRPAHDARPAGPGGRVPEPRPGSPARLSRSTSRPARCACWRPRRRTTRTTRRTPRPSTARRRGASRPARR